MFYAIYDLNSKINKSLHIYDSLDGLNQDWLDKFKEFCAKNNTDPFSLNAKCEIVPLGEDEVSCEPVEVKSFSNWKVECFTNKEKLKEFLLKAFSL